MPTPSSKSSQISPEAQYTTYCVMPIPMMSATKRFGIATGRSPSQNQRV